MAVSVKKEKEKHSQLGPELFIIDDTQLLYNDFRQSKTFCTA